MTASCPGTFLGEMWFNPNSSNREQRTDTAREAVFLAEQPVPTPRGEMNLTWEGEQKAGVCVLEGTGFLSAGTGD